MIKNLIFLFLLFPSILYAACTNTGTNEYTCTYDTSITDIQTCVAARSDGDTVIITSGSATWDTMLTVSSAIKLQGTSTTITGTMAAANYIIKYLPTVPSATAVFELSGFILDTNASPGGVELYNQTTTPVKVKIHDNSIVNVKWQQGGTATGWAFHTNGNIWGVIYKNTITAVEGEFSAPMDIIGADALAWNNLTFSAATADNLYLEDNTWTGAGTIIGSGHGSRYVYRYNNFTGQGTSTHAPLLDQHGNQPSTQYAPMGVEIYGNYFSLGANIARLLNQRGGIAHSFYNYAVTTSGGGLYDYFIEEYNDSGNNVLDYACPIADPFGYTCSSDGEYQHVNRSYRWGNWGKNSSTLALPNITIDNAADLEYNITENTDFWVQRSGTFDGSGDADKGGGVGCGTLATMQAITTCADGVGFWVPNSTIDPNANSCANPADFTGTSEHQNLTGASNALAASVNGNTGTLYKCASNTWIPYYTPYTYPHPLRVQKFSGNLCIGCGGQYN